MESTAEHVGRWLAVAVMVVIGAVVLALVGAFVWYFVGGLISNWKWFAVGGGILAVAGVLAVVFDRE